MRAHTATRTTTILKKGHKEGSFKFELVQCQDDEWQAFQKGHLAPLSDHVPLDRALQVVSDLAAICPRSTITILSNAGGHAARS
ncbi:MAG: hypothetical protein ABI599_06790 [Flavobacteriales bacterium]